MPNPSPLDAERAGAGPCVPGLALFYSGGPGPLALRTRLTALWFNDPVVRARRKLYTPFLSRTEQYKRGIALVRRMQELKVQHRLSPSEFTTLLEVTGEDLPLTVHQTVYAPAVAGQASEEQAKELVDPAVQWAHVGCYAQTELAHGSNVRGIETTATYDAATDTFVLQTPTPTATKWWVGGLGKTATHALVVARLILPDGKDYGPHPFHMRIRDARTLEPLKGLEIGDIGPKVGFVPVDNGYMRFNCVSIPRSALLSRFGRVEVIKKGGTRTKTAAAAEAVAAVEAVYVPPSHPQAAYGGMLSARAAIVRAEYLTLGMATTIAVRYSAVRRQFVSGAGAGAGSSKLETQVIDYSSQQARLFPPLATTYALRAVSVWLNDAFTAAQEAIRRGNMGVLSDMHILSSALKTHVTETVASNLEGLRRCLGGHGYSQAAGIPRLAAAQVHLVTAEGDNYILSQQVARFLLKLAGKAAASGEGAGRAAAPSSSSSSSSFDHADYLRPGRMHAPSPLPEDPSEWYASGCSAVLGALATAVVRVLSRMQDRLLPAMGDRQASALAWDACLMDAWHVTQAHGARIVLAVFAGYVSSLSSSSSSPLFAGLSRAEAEAALSRLSTLVRLQAVTSLSLVLPTLLESGDATPAAARAVANEHLRLCREVRLFAVASVDAFGFHDDMLASCLGRFDGDVYTALLEWVDHEPLNAHKASPAAEDIRAVVRLGGEAMKQAREMRAAALEAATSGRPLARKGEAEGGGSGGPTPKIRAKL
jgi:acyl-CoA oxidase